MSAQRNDDKPSAYFAELAAMPGQVVTRLVSPPSHSRRALAARRAARHALLLTAVVALLVVVLMYGLDATEIGLMPARGNAYLWPVRILTDFGKDDYVLWLVAGLLVITALTMPVLRGKWRSQAAVLGLRLQFIFLAVLLPVLVGQVIKWIVGRGRPFVGGKADAFNFAPFSGGEAYASLPSSHSITAFALGFAVAAIWPRTSIVMAIYALVIAASRLVLLAHHPSDVVAGAAIGVLGAMAVRYWFAARRLGFTIGSDGRIRSHRGW